jgi:hypothetical protein
MDIYGTERAEYIAGLRMLADVLEQHPEVQQPYTGSGSPVLIIPNTPDEQREQLAAWARVLPGKKTKDAHDNGQYTLDGAFAGLKVKVICRRSDVCERIVVGTHEVTRSVPDPAVDVPYVEVTETVEIVEWHCSPVLGAAGGAQ